MTFTLTKCIPYIDSQFALPLPAGAGWGQSHYRRSYSTANVMCTHTGAPGATVTVAVTRYPRSGEGGEYRDTNQFLKATARIPANLQWEAVKTPHGAARAVRYTDGTQDHYYALLETPAALLELDIAQSPGTAAPPFIEMIVAAQVLPAAYPPAPIWETLTLPHFRVEVPRDWPRKDEHNRPLAAAFVEGALGLSVSREEERYATRQMSRPQYRIEELARGKNLKSYLVGLKTERHRSSIDGATYRFLGEDGLRTRHARGTRLRYQGYSPRGMRGPFEWYHELMLIEVGPTPLLITAYCDWTERYHYAPIFAHVTKSLAAVG